MDPNFLTRLNTLMAKRTFGKPMFRREFKDYAIIIWLREDGLFHFTKFDRKTQKCHTLNYWRDNGKTTNHEWSYPARNLESV
jgi:hypothetical protein